VITVDAASLVIDSRTCVDNVSMTIERQGITVIIGANGSGKTLLLRLIAGLLLPTSGQLKITPQLNYPQLAYVPSTPVLLDRSVWENIVLPLRIQMKNNPSRRTERKRSTPESRTQEALQWANIESLAQQTAHSLSSGQQQLVALARAWALSPQLLLIDEPCANLDPNRQQHIESLICDMQSQCKVIMSTHNIRQAERLADDVVFLEEGKLLAHVSKKQFFNHGSDDDAVGSLPQKIDTFIRYA